MYKRYFLSMNNSRHWLAHIIQLIVILIASVCLYFQIDSELDVMQFLANLILIITLVFQYFFILQPIQKKNTDIVEDLNQKNLELLRLNEELKLSQKIIIQSHRLFTDLSDNIPGMLYQYEINSDGKSGFKYVSKEVKNLFEITIAEAVSNSNNVFSKVIESDAEEFFRTIRFSRDNLTNWMTDFRVNLPTRGIRWLHGESVPVKFEDKIVWHGYIYDVTDQKKLEAELKLSEEQFRGVFEHFAIGIAIVSIDGKFKAVNKSLSNIFGYTNDQLKDTPITKFTHAEDIEIDNNALRNLIEGKASSTNFEKRYLKKDGSIVWTSVSISALKDIDGNLLHFVTQIKDITDSKITEEAAIKTVANLKSILDASTDVAIIGTDANGIVNLFNKGAENLLGYHPEEAIGKHSPITYFRKSEIDRRRKELFAETDKKMTLAEMFIEFTNKNENESRQWTMKRKNGTKFLTQLIVTKIKNQNNELIGYLAIASDISTIKEKEKQLQYLIDVTSEQNKRLINFAHIVSHNLRSHSGNFSLLLGLYDSEVAEIEKQEILRLLKKASHQLTETVSNLNEVLAITANLNEKRELLNLDEEINRIQIILSEIIHEKNVEVINEVDKDFYISIVPAYLESILLNLITNAIKYSSPLRKPTIKLTATNFLNYIVLNIEDNGIGIDLEMHEHKIFGMYKTFHGNKDARGIGLFITKNQVEAMRGKIEVQSKVDVGTTFKVFFSNKNDFFSNKNNKITHEKN